MKIKDLDMLRDINILFDNKIVLYGAGNYGKRAIKLLEQLQIPIFGLCDSNENKMGEIIRGHRVLDIQELVCISRKEQFIVIFCMANSKDIEQVMEILQQYDLPKITYYTYFALKFTVELHIDDIRINKLYRDNFCEARRVYNEWRYYAMVNSVREYIWSIKLQDVTLVLSPRKVGSSSVAQSLRKSSIACIQTDYLLSRNVANIVAPEKEQVMHVLHNEKRIRIISLVRDPISRALSDYFYGLFMDGYARDYINLESDIYQAINSFIEKETTIGKYGFMFDWFNQEIQTLFNIDVYKYYFDKEKGYQIIHKDNVDLLLLKTEKLDSCQQIIGQFVGNEDFQLERKNVANEKLYTFAYNELKRTIEIPEHIIDFYYKGNEALDHFYTEEEKRQFIEKWSR